MSIPETLMLAASELAEGEEAPIGTRRVRADGTYVKTKNGWERTDTVKGPVFAPRAKAKEEPKRKRKTATQRSQDDLIRGRMAWLDREMAKKRGE